MSGEKAMLRREGLKFFIIFGITILVVLLLIYRKTKVVVYPVKKLAENVVRITHGHLNERAEVIGNNEITQLSIEFNKMIEELESYTNELEQKVKERTAEIQQQKEEIEAQRDSIQEQKEHIEVQNELIMDSIHYAKRIQNAILPPREYVHSLLDDVFILYRPKDIVSGDFYWMTDEDGYIMVSAVDCTGHGVPGAFMSIVGYNQLNYAVNVKNARTASEILMELNVGVTDTLREKGGTGSVKDGMDLALCVIDPKARVLHYAGAYNPLVLIRNKELIIYKANKCPIGSVEGEEFPEFTNHEIPIQKGDCYYMFSDGFPDQFGGPKGKKFMSKRFRELLHEIHEKPMTEQQMILEKTLDDWMGDENEQVDDILVMGIKL
jgi:serine phosphatase RsbU (regulator of sigma subunit)